jgi:adenine-specific DNA-methyltransferase
MVKEMIKLIQYDEKILEPSSGDGAFLNFLPKEKTIGIEIDEKFKFENVLNMDFFKYSTSNKFKTIIGNPPYIKNKEIYESTRELLPNIFDKRTNLYIYFM